MKRNQINRRAFLAQAGVGTLGVSTILSPSIKAGRTDINGKITLGFIGIGMMGRGHLGRFLKHPEVEVVALCDVAQVRLEDAWERVQKAYGSRQKSGHYRGCAMYRDFRDLIARDDIDAVVIATPDHWHVIPAIMAAEAGKDIYCEKPLTLFIGEGRVLVDAVRRNRTVFQTGSQQRSEFGGKFHRAAELVRNGRIGKVKTIRVGVGPSPKPCDLPEKETPADIDWDMWIGPSPYRGFNEALCPVDVHRHFPAFRRYREYAGGSLADMGAHHFDIAQWALGMDHSGPIRVDPPASPMETGLKFTYANGTVMYHGGPSGCTFEGTDGSLYVDRSKLEAHPSSILKERIGNFEIQLEKATNHRQNWIDAIRSGTMPIADVEIGHRTASVCHLANLGYQLRRSLRWNPSSERFEGDDKANTHVDRPYRAPWATL
jgi:predicted dehydrogenase